MTNKKYFSNCKLCTTYRITCLTLQDAGVLYNVISLHLDSISANCKLRAIIILMKWVKCGWRWCIYIYTSVATSELYIYIYKYIYSNISNFIALITLTESFCLTGVELCLPKANAPVSKEWSSGSRVSRPRITGILRWQCPVMWRNYKSGTRNGSQFERNIRLKVNGTNILGVKLNMSRYNCDYDRYVEFVVTMHSGLVLPVCSYPRTIYDWLSVH